MKNMFVLLIYYILQLLKRKIKKEDTLVSILYFYFMIYNIISIYIILIFLLSFPFFISLINDKLNLKSGYLKMTSSTCGVLLVNLFYIS